MKFKQVGGSKCASLVLIYFALAGLTMNSASLDTVVGDNPAVGKVSKHSNKAKRSNIVTNILNLSVLIFCNFKLISSLKVVCKFFL